MRPANFSGEARKLNPALIYAARTRVRQGEQGDPGLNRREDLCRPFADAVSASLINSRTNFFA